MTPWLQHARLPCPSLSPWVCSNSCPLSRWCHPTTSSSVAPFSSCPHQSFPASGSLPMSQLFASGGQSVRASASASVLPMNIQGWFPLGLTGFSRVFSSTALQKLEVDNPGIHKKDKRTVGVWGPLFTADSPYFGLLLCSTDHPTTFHQVSGLANYACAIVWSVTPPPQHPVCHPQPGHACMLNPTSPRRGEREREREGILSGKIPRFVLDYWR